MTSTTSTGSWLYIGTDHPGIKAEIESERSANSSDTVLEFSSRNYDGDYYDSMPLRQEGKELLVASHATRSS